MIDHAFILAAGMGSRLRPYTDDRPKPMVEVGGVPVIDGILHRLAAAGVEQVTVNLHYRGEQLAAHLAGRTSPQITLSREETLLETGGGVKHALATTNGQPFYVIAGDTVWTDGPGGNALTRLARAWDPARMDILTLLMPVDHMVLTHGVGDYDLDPDGRVRRSFDKTGAHMFTNIRINRPEIFADAPDGPFSFLTLMDRAQAAGRFYGLVHDGDWHHISTPQELERVNAALGKNTFKDEG